MPALLEDANPDIPVLKQAKAEYASLEIGLQMTVRSVISRPGEGN